MVILALFVFPHIPLFQLPELSEQVSNDLANKALLFAVMLPNVVLLLYNAAVPYASQAWSIGVEEQFYLIWPLIISAARRYGLVLGGMLVFLVVLRHGLWFVLSPNRNIASGSEVLRFISYFLNLFRIQSMCIGGLFALVLYREYNTLIGIISNKLVQVVSWIVIFALVAIGKFFSYFNYEIYSVLFGIIVFNLCLEKTSIIAFKGKVLDYLGKISYSLYMLHSIAIVAALRLIPLAFPGLTGWSEHTLCVILSLLLTVGLSALSYRFVEKPFLTLKHRFARVKSGN